MIPSCFYNNRDELVFPDNRKKEQHAYFQDWLDFIIAGSPFDHYECKDMSACAINALETGIHVEIIQAIIDALDTKLQDPSLNWDDIGHYTCGLQRCSAAPPKWDEPKYRDNEITKKLLQLELLLRGRRTRMRVEKNGTVPVAVTVTP